MFWIAHIHSIQNNCPILSILYIHPTNAYMWIQPTFRKLVGKKNLTSRWLEPSNQTNKQNSPCSRGSQEVVQKINAPKNSRNSRSITITSEPISQTPAANPQYKSVNCIRLFSWTRNDCSESREDRCQTRDSFWLVWLKHKHPAWCTEIYCIIIQYLTKP